MVYKCLCHILYFARCVKQRTAFAYTVLFQNPQVLISIKKIKRFVPMTDNTFCSNIFYENKIAEESCYYRQRQIKVSYQLMCWGEDSLALLQLCWFVTAESCIWIQNLIWWGILECVCLGLVFLALVLFCWFFSSNLQRQKEENLMLLWRLANKAWRPHGGSGQGTVCSWHTTVPQPAWLFLDVVHQAGRQALILMVPMLFPCPILVPPTNAVGGGKEKWYLRNVMLT